HAITSGFSLFHYMTILEDLRTLALTMKVPKHLRERIQLKKNNHKLITNGQIIDVESGAISHGAIEIKNGMIERTYEEKEFLPRHIEQIDLHGKYIIP